jgi:hypothetical protein
VIILKEGDNMLRTQVSLDEQGYRSAKKEAAALGISVAEYVRRAVRSALPTPPSRGQPKWTCYAGLVESGNPQSSQSIDEIAYGEKD